VSGVRRTDPAAAVSYLFVPATRPDRVAKALATDADEVIIDLEDAVAPHDTDAARTGLASLSPARPCLVRINGVTTPYHDADVGAVARLAWVSGVVVPKVESAADVAAVMTRLDAAVAVLPIVETARGLLAVADIAASGAVRLLMGIADYLADIGAPVGREVLLLPRSQLVVASAAAGIAPPIDGPAFQIDRLDALEADAADAKALGMGAKLCIHPTQVAVVNRVFRPSEAEVAWARRVTEAAESHAGAFAVDGEMIDEPVLRRARRILAAPSVSRSEP
jgi:citrate lyase subunit beta/citryl-CoA lyase